ncbi:arylamine N-acetyltransferase family protein [Vibrio sp. T11.5]|uniref:arylamine N-acetyltransferase family protein n=1 Tax=Vibrio sp. T11.5 TaxID=2998836 RepID=UPI0022CD71C8|nr:arylamine N-acetyltransferase [Vibrio sp. T11.5]MDA0117738.1 arylamine N-acetyltransferase [Vibrio sp. T11.5]
MDSSRLNQYLAKIGLSYIPQTTIEDLTVLHRAQHRRIPFENFDVALRRTINLSDDALFEKLVLRERGGYCFEVNALLLNALKSLGFDATPLLGRVHLGPEPSGRSHLVSLVVLDGQEWIVDVGFGSHTPRTPIPVVFDREIPTDLQTLRFEQHSLYGAMLQAKIDDEWIDLYSLDFTHVCASDIAYGNFYMSTCPDSSFLQKRLATIPTDDGIITLLNSTLKIKANGHIEEKEIAEDESYLMVLKQMFGIELDANFDDFIPLNKDM